MKSFKIPAVGWLLAALSVLSASPVSGQIILQQSEDPADELTRCTYEWECFKEQQIEQEEKAQEELSPWWWVPLIKVEASQLVTPQLTLDMPNLVAMDADGKIRSAGVGVKAEVVNDGTVDAGAFDFSGNVTFVKVDDGSTYGPYAVQTRIYSLPAGQGWDDYLGWVTPPDRDHAWDVHITVTADSRYLQNGGEVRESKEEDNVLMSVCRMAGMLPGQNIAGSVPACQ